MTILAIALLSGLGLVGLAMIPLGLPGLWVMVGGILAYGWLTGFRTVSVVMIAIILAIAFLGEIIDNWLGFRFAKRYGGSTRSGWGAVMGRIAAAAVKIALGIVIAVIGLFAALS